MLTAYKFRLYPTQEQEEFFFQCFGAKRFIWNKALDLCKTRLYNGDYVPSFFELNKMLTLWKKADEWSFLRDAPKDIMQITLDDLSKAFGAMFKGQRREPRFKKKYDTYQSFTVIASAWVKDNVVKIPKLKEPVKFRRSQRVKGKVKRVTVSFDGFQWFVSILVDAADVIKPSKGKTCGLDIGVKRLATLSDGTFVSPIHFTKDIQKLEKHQRSMSRKIKGSARWSKAKSRVQKAYRRISNRRKDYLHKASTAIADEYSTIFIEDLNIKNMSKSAKGTADLPGKNVAQKRGLNKAILSQGWYMFFEMLSYKTEQRGGKVLKVDPKFTSQICSNCGYKSKENRESQSMFKCKKCGNTQNADHNAAKNIYARGLRVNAQGKGSYNELD